jgi:hypothetical protein
MENAGGCGLDSTGSAYASEAGSCEYGNIILGSIKAVISADFLSDN